MLMVDLMVLTFTNSDLFFIDQLSYWEVFNAEEIRQLVLGRHSSLTALSISRNGDNFITATQDSLVKVIINPKKRITSSNNTKFVIFDI